MQKLGSTCPEMVSLEVQHTNLEETFSASDLPVALKTLSLIRCEIPLTWFVPLRLDFLDSIDLSSSSRVCWRHLSDLLLTCKRTLRRLKLKDCYRVDDNAVEVISKAELTLLESLDLQGTVLTQYGLQLIGCKLASQLICLNLADCRHLTRGDIDLFKTSMGRDIVRGV